MRVELSKEIHFEAAHRNEHGGEPQQRLHGHSYRMHVTVEGEVVSEYGWLIDFGDIRQALQPLYEQLDHAYLNELPGLDDASLLGLREWILEQGRASLPVLTDVRVEIVGDCAFKLMELMAEPQRSLPARLEFSFEAAQYLPQLPGGHPCRNLHGHSYRVQVGAPVLRRLIEPLERLYHAVDHRCLNEIDGLGEATCEQLCKWMWDWLSREEAGAEVIAIHETQSSCCIYRGA